jgi:hypothetical protein
MRGIEQRHTIGDLLMSTSMLSASALLALTLFMVGALVTIG